DGLDAAQRIRTVKVLMVHARQPVADELLGNVRQRSAPALQPLLGRQLRPLPNLVEDDASAVGHPTIEIARGIVIICSAGRVDRVPSQACQLQSLAVVKGGVAPTMVNSDG